MISRISIAVFALVFSGCASQPVNRVSDEPLQTVAAVDLDQYLGRWYEIARLPNSFEKNCEGVTANYARRDDGLISVVNVCRKGDPAGKVKKATGRARIVDPETNAKLEVSFFGPFWGDYWIIYLEDDYSLSIVGEPSGRYLWVLSRAPILSDDKKAFVLNMLRSIGYDTTALYFTRQPPADESVN